ncbi:MAG: hypothetical protein V5A64_06440 [Candidatus Thermoplasmatota archaeon]
MTETKMCCVCGKEHDKEEVHNVTVKTGEKSVCDGCLTAIKGII